MKISAVPPGEYIYLIQERESFRCGDNVYKIGKTTQEPYKRMDNYPKSSISFMTIIVDNCSEAELDLLTLFRSKYVNETRMGNEYFIGDPIEMMNDIYEYQRSHFKVDSLMERSAQREQTLASDDGLTKRNGKRDNNDTIDDDVDITNTSSKGVTLINKPITFDKLKQNKSPVNKTESVSKTSLLKSPRINRELPSARNQSALKLQSNVNNDDSSKKSIAAIGRNRVSLKQTHTPTIAETIKKHITESKTIHTPTIAETIKKHITESKTIQPSKRSASVKPKLSYRSEIDKNKISTVTKIGTAILKEVNNTKCSVDIHATFYKEFNLFDVTSIEVIYKDETIAVYDFVNDNGGDMENHKHFRLTGSQMYKFNAVYKPEISNYIIRIESLSMRYYNKASYYLTSYHVDEDASYSDVDEYEEE